jgi:hypothetical protein
LHLQLYDIENFIQVLTQNHHHEEQPPCSLSLFPSIVAIIRLAKRIEIGRTQMPLLVVFFCFYVHTHMHATNNLYNIIVDPITKFQKQRTIISNFQKKNQNQRTANYDYFQTLAEPTALVKEPVKNRRLFRVFFMIIKVLNQKTGSFPKMNKIGGPFRNPKNCPDNRWGSQLCNF